mmetsp:Transcript_4113/g.6755  ORF Transcript_4113/g.6755 Transcript_4113/m.6755 type:complete len:241 (+) Transcript_4113:2033-2755(+)
MAAVLSSAGRGKNLTDLLPEVAPAVAPRSVPPLWAGAVQAEVVQDHPSAKVGFSPPMVPAMAHLHPTGGLHHPTHSPLQGTLATHPQVLTGTGPLLPMVCHPLACMARPRPMVGMDLAPMALRRPAHTGCRTAPPRHTVMGNPRCLAVCPRLGLTVPRHPLSLLCQVTPWRSHPCQHQVQGEVRLRLKVTTSGSWRICRSSSAESGFLFIWMTALSAVSNPSSLISYQVPWYSSSPCEIK